jgi:hypothetical protein
VIAGSGARDIEQVPLGVVHVFEIGFVGDALDPLLQRDRRNLKESFRRRFAAKTATSDRRYNL